MCGIAALFGFRDPSLDATIEAMTACLTHRGPDDSGTITFPQDGVALGMRRLSILDIEGGHQPMWDEERRHCLVFNGEIYNFAPLRAELVSAGHRFATDHSDTEVLVHGFEEWGTDLFARLNGMFAVAIWDAARKRLVVARDRAGEKPLYVGRTNGGYAIASEMKSLLGPANVNRTLDPVAIEQYLSFDYALGPRTVVRDIRKLEAASYAVTDAAGYHEQSYWAPRFPIEKDSDEEASIERLDAALDRSVHMRMVADVPVGLFLSGGLDSSTVGWYMCRHSDNVHSFSIGFEEPEYDESAYAALAARHLGTHHHVEIFSQDKIRELVPRIADILDEPMGDQSIFPTYLLSRFTRQHVKVALGGDGSDELLMGYKAYQPLKAAWSLDPVPRPVRLLAASVSRRLPTHAFGRGLRGVQFARHLDKLPAERLFAHLGSFKGNARWLMTRDMQAELPPTVFSGVADHVLDGVGGRLGPADETIVAYLRGYLQQDILTKVDRASMAASLEVRAPFLDPDVIDLTFSVPPSLKLNGMTRKYLLRQLMRNKLPDAIIDRGKLGFGVPLNQWLRDSLAPLVRETLSAARIREAGIFDPACVKLVVDQHLGGIADRGNELWLLLQFELWRERWLTAAQPV